MKFLSTKDVYVLLVLALAKITSLLFPHQLKVFVVEGITLAAYYIARSKRQLSEKALAKVFHEKLSDEQVREIVKGSFRQFWCDTLSMWPSSRERAAIESANMKGMEYLERAVENGKGTILWESRFGQRSLAKRALREKGFLIHQVHGGEHFGAFYPVSRTWVADHLIKPLLEKCERQYVSEIIHLPHSDSLAFTRTLLNTMKRNAILCIAGDGKAGHKLIPVNFLGHTEYFSTGMVSLAKISGASILPIFSFVDKQGRSRVIIEDAVHTDENVAREDDLKRSILQYTDLLEAYVRKYPEQYRNWHLLGDVDR
ncbi:MAG: lysophospholipid acyltransferase family protein [Gammaproteobacteria bacterium]|nr:lysophospholipid acyltransferase family protein [Gammaproteobacteria bacterium]